MIDLDILRSVGSTNERLKEVFTARLPETGTVSDEEFKKREADVKMREFWEKRINSRLSAQIKFSLDNQQIWSAVDLAWDSRPINKDIYPLMQYAQGYLDLGACVTQLNTLKCAEKYVTKNDKGDIIGIDFPAFTDGEVNIIRSVITRRLAAQSNRYANLWPYYKYEPRFTSPVGKLRADLTSQRMDIMTDQYDYRHHDLQVLRDTFLYTHCVDFSRRAWEREIQWTKVDIADELKTDAQKDGSDVPKKAVITKEGLSFINPHPSRVIWDNAYPLSSINTDSGCTFIGFWDVVRYRDINEDPCYWNRDQITYSSNVVSLFSTYSQYFTQYYCTLRPPQTVGGRDMAGANDRENLIGFYASEHGDMACVTSNYYEKIIPKDHGFGDYPYPVWVRFVTAGDKTVVYAEFYPYTPATYCGHNEHDGRQINISIAHELMGYQDHMSNLLSYLMLSMKSDCHKMLLLNTDVLSETQILQLRKEAKGEAYLNQVQVVEVSFSKSQGMGIDPTRSMQFVETRSSAQINIVFQAMLQLLSLVERMMALSPQEQGQPAPREISATETNLIAGTTESVYSFVSDSFDAYRAAKKRQLYYAWQAFGDNKFRLPVVNRYPLSVIEKAGLEAADEGDPTDDPGEPLRSVTVTGSKSKLIADYIFTTRDGAERASNPQTAQALIQFLTLLLNPAILPSIPKSKLFEIINEVSRKLNADIDLNLEVNPGEPDKVGVDVNQQVQGLLAQLTAQVEGLSAQAEQQQQVAAQLTGMLEQMQTKLDALAAENQQLKAIDHKGVIETARAEHKMQIESTESRHQMDLERAQVEHDMALKGVQTVGDLAIKKKASQLAPAK